MTRLAHSRLACGTRMMLKSLHGKVCDEKEGNELQRIDKRMLKGMHHYFHNSNQSFYSIDEQSSRSRRSPSRSSQECDSTYHSANVLCGQKDENK